MSSLDTSLALDMGASSVRLVLGTLDSGRLAFRELDRLENGPVDIRGNLHWDVLRIWRWIEEVVARCMQEGMQRPATLGVDAWGVDFGLLDERGELLGNPYHYRDRRTEGVRQRTFAEVSEERLYGITGIQQMPINTLFQLYAMREADDPRLRAATHLLFMPDLITYWLTGVRSCEYTVASTSQLLDARKRNWAGEIIRELDLPSSLFPPIAAPGTVIGNVTGAAAGLREINGAAVVAACSHDTASAVAAIPDLEAESAFISSGTWSLVGVEVEQPILSETARRLNFTNEGGFGDTIRLLKNVSGLWLLQECRRCWRNEGVEAGWDDILEQAARAPALRSTVDPDEPRFLNPPDMVAAIREFCERSGQPVPQTMGEVARCCLESLALRYRWIVEALESLTGRDIRVLRVVGGGSNNNLLNQLTADICGREVVAGPVEATALGNLLVQLLATGRLEDIAAGRRLVADSFDRRRFEPKAVAGLDAAFDRFKELLSQGTA